MLILALIGAGRVSAQSSSSGPIRNSGTTHAKPPVIHPEGSASKTGSDQSGRLAYYGGPVIANAHVIAVNWNSGVDAALQNGLPGFYEALVQSEAIDWLDSVYSADRAPSVGSALGTAGAGQHIGRGTYGGQYTLGQTATQVTDADISAALKAAIASGTLPYPDSNTVFMVSFPPNMVITYGDQQSCSGDSDTRFCGYHSTAALAGGALIRYAVLPDTSIDCNQGCGNDPSYFNNATAVASHELIETMTNPNAGLDLSYGYDYPTGWATTTNDPTQAGEIGDLCNLMEAPIAATKPDGTHYVVQMIYDNSSGQCIVSKGQPQNNFTLAMGPGQLSLAPGHSATSRLSTALLGSSTQALTLSVAAISSGLTASFDRTHINAGDTASLTVSASRALAAGTYSITISAVGPLAKHATTLFVTVSPAGLDFDLQPWQSALTLPQGTNGSVNIDTLLLSYFGSEALELDVAGLPTGVNGNLEPASLMAGDTTTLSLQADPSAAPGVYPLFVTARASGRVLTTEIDLTVASAPISQLASGVTIDGLAATASFQSFYAFTVPAGQSQVTFQTSGGKGDADLYVRAGAAPSLSSWDCRPYLVGNNESCTLTPPAAGATYYVMLNAFTDYAGVSLVATGGPQGNGATALTSGTTVSGISGAKGSQRVFTLKVPASASTVSFSLAGPAGVDADLYVRYGAAPTTTTYDCRPYLSDSNESCKLPARAGTWYAVVRGYTAISGVSLVARYQ